MKATDQQSTSPSLPVLEGLLQAVQRMALDHNGLEPVVFFIKDTNVGIAPVASMGIDMNSAEDKRRLNSIIKTACLEQGVDSCILMSEAWLASIKAEDMEEKLGGLKDGKVSSLPRSERTEVGLMMLRIFNPTQERWTGTFELIRDSKGVLHNFGPVNWMAERENAHVTGTLLF